MNVRDNRAVVDLDGEELSCLGYALNTSLRESIVRHWTRPQGHTGGEEGFFADRNVRQKLGLMHGMFSLAGMPSLYEHYVAEYKELFRVAKEVK